MEAERKIKLYAEVVCIGVSWVLRGGAYGIVRRVDKQHNTLLHTPNLAQLK